MFSDSRILKKSWTPESAEMMVSRIVYRASCGLPNHLADSTKRPDRCEVKFATVHVSITVLAACQRQVLSEHAVVHCTAGQPGSAWRAKITEKQPPEARQHHFAPIRTAGWLPQVVQKVVRVLARTFKNPHFGNFRSWISLNLRTLTGTLRRADYFRTGWYRLLA